MSPELSEFMQNGRISKIESFCNTLEIPVVIKRPTIGCNSFFFLLFLLPDNLVKDLIHLKQFLFGDQCSNLPDFFHIPFSDRLAFFKFINIDNIVFFPISFFALFWLHTLLWFMFDIIFYKFLII